MFGLLTDYFVANDNKEERCREVADTMLRLVTTRGRVVLDSAATLRLGANYATAFQAACALALGEKIQIRSTETGEVQLLANWDYERLLWLESTPDKDDMTDEDTIQIDYDAAGDDNDGVISAALADMIEQLDSVPQPKSDIAAELPETSVETALEEAAALCRDEGYELLAASEETTRILPPTDTEGEIHTVHNELDWFTIDVAPPEDESALAEENVPLDRQSLPERKREPYVALEDAVLEKWEK
ncbi:MAG: hypothetical protein LIP23_09900 [Planctomycetes bacterium]|nr:hypothetical protein [Planctomycetota bacterium]